jgi:hypothetical protein
VDILWLMVGAARRYKNIRDLQVLVIPVMKNMSFGSHFSITSRSKPYVPPIFGGPIIVSAAITLYQSGLGDSPERPIIFHPGNKSLIQPAQIFSRTTSYKSLLHPTVIYYTILSCTETKMCTQTTYTYTSSDCDCEYIVFICCSRAKIREGTLPSCRGGPVIKRSEMIEGGCWGTDCWMQGRRCAKE